MGPLGAGDQAPGYRGDLSFVHDAGFSELARLGASAALRLLEEAPAGPVFEVGCGGGVTAARILAAGRDVVGVDLSPAQIDLARRRVPAGEFSVASYIDAELPPAPAAILAFGEIFNYSSDGRSGLGALAEFAARAFSALPGGGFLLFDSAGPGRAPEGATRGFAEGPDWAILYESSERQSPPELVREITTFRRYDGIWRREHETHRLHLYEPRAVSSALEEVGFRVEVRPGYGESRFAPSLDVFVAHRPGGPSSGEHDPA